MSQGGALSGPPPPLFGRQLDGSPVAVVTGGNRGIGLATARALDAAGYTVCITSRDLAAGVAAARTISGRVRTYRAHVDRTGDLDQVAQAIRKDFGRIDAWVNNAGYWATRAALDIEREEWDRMLAVNLTGVLLGSQAAARAMDGRGSIVNVASVIGPAAVRGRAAYATAKAAVIALTRVLALEWAELNIRVNAVAPGFVQGDERDEDGGDFTYEQIRRRTPIGRYIERSEVASAVLFLAGEAASATTGSVIYVDGGWIADGGWHGRD